MAEFTEKQKGTRGVYQPWQLLNEKIEPNISNNQLQTAIKIDEQRENHKHEHHFVRQCNHPVQKRVNCKI